MPAQVQRFLVTLEGSADDGVMNIHILRRVLKRLLRAGSGGLRCTDVREVAAGVTEESQPLDAGCSNRGLK
jgi:hypothetical protein